MACLAFGRAALLTHPSFGDRQLEELGRQLSVAEDLGRVAQECAVFDALAQQVTAFITNLDEATVNCGAAEPSTFQISSSSGNGISSRAASSSSGSSSGKASAAVAAATASAGSSSGGAGAAPACFRRLKAAQQGESGEHTRALLCTASQALPPAGSLLPPPAPHSPACVPKCQCSLCLPAGFGWQDRRAAFELAMQQENRVERLVARSDPAAAEKRLQQRLLVARLEAFAFKGCSGAWVGRRSAGQAGPGPVLLWRQLALP